MAYLRSRGYSGVEQRPSSSLPKSSLFKSEKEVQDWFLRVFGEWFYIAKEVPGKHLIEDSQVRIDFMLHPKQVLVENGFYQKWFGVEVKLYPNHEKDLAAPSKALWQAVSYNNSKFYLNESEFLNFQASELPSFKASELSQGIRPSYTMLFSNRSFKKGYEEYLHQDGKENENKFEYIMRTISVLGLYAKVGVINVIEFRDRSNLQRWKFNFGRETYFSYCRQDDKDYMQDEFKLRNKEIVTKIRVGHQ